MEICYLPVEKLKLNVENLFSPLSGYEYEDLRGSIARYGIQEPLIVTHGENGFYIVVSGNNRLRIAGEIGIKTLPCSIIDITSIEGALDTEIFRRHLSPEDRKRYKALKEEKCGEIFEREMERKLIPELFDRYKKGHLRRECAIGAMKLNIEEQTTLIQSVETVDDTQPVSSEEDEVVELQEEIAHLKEVLSKKNQDISELKQWKEQNRERLEEKLAELEKEKNKASKVVKKEFEAEVKNLMETNEKLVSQIKGKQAEIEKIKEEKESFERLLVDKEVEVKAEKIHFAEVEKKYMVNTIILDLDVVLEKIKTIRNHMEFGLAKGEASVVKERVKSIVERGRELLAYLDKNN